ncbi:MAG: AAA family ATPase [Phycisphaerae bacterium]|nr:AAA family ATPase [Phycisphaerae bacterium]
MHLTRIYIDGFKRLTDFDLSLNEKLNVIVGDNETGKTSVLEAINLVLTCQYDGRSIFYGVDPYLFNLERVAEYFATLRSGKLTSAPTILIEAYFNDDCQDPELGELTGTHGHEHVACPGLQLHIKPNNEYTEELKEYVTNPNNPDLIPVEYYTVVWQSFKGETIKPRAAPLRAKLIDTSIGRAYRGPNMYLAQVVKDDLEPEDRQALSLAYRKLRHEFSRGDGLKSLNKKLEQRHKSDTGKKLTVQMDQSSRSSWESAITPHLDDLPFDCAGKGEQCRIQMRVAIAGAAKSRVLLIEEPENHLSHSNMSKLMAEIAAQCDDKHQVIVATHSAYVLNKLGIDNLRLISQTGQTAALGGLDPSTSEYFMKLPGYDTLRLILAKRSILVEGPSDELIVQRGYKDKHGKLPLEDGVDVISVRSLAFKRFLEIAVLLNLNVCVVTDNDGKIEALRKKYANYLKGAHSTIRILYDDDEHCPTLEPQLLKANNRERLNAIFEKTYEDDAALLKYMGNPDHKTDWALRMFKSTENWTVPEYIKRAIE